MLIGFQTSVLFLPYTIMITIRHFKNVIFRYFQHTLLMKVFYLLVVKSLNTIFCYFGSISFFILSNTVVFVYEVSRMSPSLSSSWDMICHCCYTRHNRRTNLKNKFKTFLFLLYQTLGKGIDIWDILIPKQAPYLTTF